MGVGRAFWAVVVLLKLCSELKNIEDCKGRFREMHLSFALVVRHWLFCVEKFSLAPCFNDLLWTENSCPCLSFPGKHRAVRR